MGGWSQPLKPPTWPVPSCWKKWWQLALSFDDPHGSRTTIFALKSPIFVGCSTIRMLFIYNCFALKVSFSWMVPFKAFLGWETRALQALYFGLTTLTTVGFPPYWYIKDHEGSINIREHTSSTWCTSFIPVSPLNILIIMMIIIMIGIVIVYIYIYVEREREIDIYKERKEDR